MIHGTKAYCSGEGCCCWILIVQLFWRYSSNVQSRSTGRLLSFHPSSILLCFHLIFALLFLVSVSWILPEFLNFSFWVPIISLCALFFFLVLVSFTLIFLKYWWLTSSLSICLDIPVAIFSDISVLNFHIHVKLCTLIHCRCLLMS